MRVVYSPVHLGHEIRHRDPDGRPGPGQRGRRTRRAHPRRPGGRRRLRAGRADRARRGPDHRRPRSGPPRVPARRLGGDPSRPASRTGSWRPRPSTSRSSTRACPTPSAASRRTSPAASGYRALDTSTPIVAGTYAAARAAVDVALTAVDLVLGGETGRLRAVPAARPPRGALDVRRLLLLQQRRDRGRGDRARRTGEPVAILDVDYHHGNGTEQIFWRRGDVLYVSLHAHPDRAVPVLPRLARRDRGGRGRGRQPQHPAAGRRRRTSGTSRRSTAASSASRTTAGRRSWSRSASTPTGSTRWATSR